MFLLIFGLLTANITPTPLPPARDIALGIGGQLLNGVYWTAPREVVRLMKRYET